MENNNNIRAELALLREKNKFSDEEWAKTGMSLSDPDTNSRMDDAVNAYIDLLLSTEGLEKIPATQKSSADFLETVDKHQFDTDEREFLVEWFFKVSGMVGLDIKFELNKWLYGNLLAQVVHPRDIRSDQTVIADVVTYCTECKSELLCRILEIQDDIPSERSIVRCKTCGEYNLMALPRNIFRSYNTGFESVKELSYDKYSEEEAQIRLKQYRDSRKQSQGG